MTRGFPLLTRAILSCMVRMLWADFMVDLWLVVTQEWCLEEHGRSLTKGQNTVNFSAVFCCGGDPNLWASAVETRRIRSGSRTFRHEAEKPGGRFLHHIAELSSRTTGRNIGKDCSATNLDRGEAVAAALSWSNRQHAWKLRSDWSQISEIQFVTNFNGIQSIEGLAKYVWDCLCGEQKISWSITLVFEKLSKELPKHLAVDSSQDTQQATAGNGIQQSERTPKVELPGREQHGPVDALNLR